jgi:thiol-disulfide isomerase/thioredoxin
MKRFFVITLVGLTVVILVILTGQRGSAPNAGQPATYAATLLDSGQSVSVASLIGKPAILSSWASWCAECQHELPSLEKLWESRKNDGLMVVAVNIDVDGANPAIKTMIDKMKLSMPIWHDADNNYSNFFSAPGVPTSVLLNTTGQVVKTWIGRTDFQDQEVLTSIDTALAS